ncbi:serine/threonine-protein phosphatase 7 long form homolog [Gossypium arboreum]|uniref:serine/threonine-protein phosphatase 7 long form homolog n=1 Tax=Gossypium arboreum TaxID=29729 RepID=UPI0022F19CD4|nr:serine/threonine-protein phosphatase 7 long form homolog [Gossypium arboreum]
MGWLQDTFPKPDNDSTELERIQYARAYILEIIRGYLMPDLSRNLVHLRWLLKLVDFRAAGELSWGSVVLAKLYKEMCGAMLLNKAKIGGCLSLLQSWARFRFPFLRPRMDHPYTFPLITRWNRSASYVGIPNSLEDIRLLLDQRSDTQHVKVPLVNYATVEMHQSDRVLRQFGFRQPIPVAPEVFDEEHKVDLQLLNMDWPRYWSGYIEMWENRYDYIPTREPIIIPELACVPEYMPWFRIYGKPYLLSEEERRRQIRVQRERRGPLNLRRRDDDLGPSTAPTQSAGPSTAPIQSASPSTALPQSPGPTAQQTTPTSQPFPSPMPGWNPWPGSSPFLITSSQPPIYRPSSHERSQETPSRGSSFYQSQSPYGVQTPPPWVMQTPLQSLFY